MIRKVQPVSHLESHLGYWLRFLSNHVSHAFRLKVEARGVTVAEWVVLRSLFDTGNISPSQLAKKIGMTRGTISKLVDRLIAKGLLTRKSEKEDRRYQSIALTPSGQKLVPSLASLADQNDHEFFGNLSKQERACLATTLKDIVERRGLKGIPVD